MNANITNLYKKIKAILAALPGKADAEDVPTDLADLAQDSSHRVVTDAEKAAWNNKADKPTIKTTMDAVATVNTQYFLGTQSAVSIVLPSNVEAGQQISVVWYNGATAATLSINAASGAQYIDPGYTPSANTRSEINAMWDGTYWAVVINEQAVPEVTA